MGAYFALSIACFFFRQIYGKVPNGKNLSESFTFVCITRCLDLDIQQEFSAQSSRMQVNHRHTVRPSYTSPCFNEAGTPDIQRSIFSSKTVTCAMIIWRWHMLVSFKLIDWGKTEAGGLFWVRGICCGWKLVDWIGSVDNCELQPYVYRIAPRVNQVLSKSQY
jgi:hypothetical protein